MANKYALMSDKSKLETLKDNLKYASSDLIEASTASARLGSTIENHYQVNDGRPKMSKKADEIAKEIKETSDFLKNTVLPEIDNTIKDLEKQIADIEEEERKAEEERRKASEITFSW